MKKKKNLKMNKLNEFDKEEGARKATKVANEQLAPVLTRFGLLSKLRRVRCPK